MIGRTSYRCFLHPTFVVIIQSESILHQACGIFWLFWFKLSDAIFAVCTLIAAATLGEAESTNSIDETLHILCSYTC